MGRVATCTRPKQRVALISVGPLFRGIVRFGAFVTLGSIACSGSYLGALTDAGPDVPDTSPVPTPSAPVEAGSDAKPADATIDAGPVSPCAAKSLFCDDFDDRAVPFGAPWSGTESAAGPFDYDETTFVSPGRALRLRLAPSMGTSGSSLRKDLDVPAAGFRLSFEFRMDRSGPRSFDEIDPFFVRITPSASGTQQIALAIYGESMQLETYRGLPDGGTGRGASTVVGSLEGSFHSIRLTVRGANGMATSTLEIDGTVRATESFPAQVPTKAAIYVGSPYVASVATMTTLRIDNVLVEAL